MQNDKRNPQEDKMILYVYVSYKRTTKYKKQKLMEATGEKDKSISSMETSTHLSLHLMKLLGKKISKIIEDRNNRVNKIEFRYIKH